MSEKTMYFGTQARMTWVKAPTIDMPMGRVGWQTTSQFLNGGASVRTSSATHMEYQMTWPLASAEDTAAINNYADKLYGNGLIYFLDPFAVTTNVLPKQWATPALAIDDAPTFNGSDVRPTGVATSTSYGYPSTSAVYTFDSTSMFKSLWIPLPTGYEFHFGAHGSSTGTAAITLNGSSVSVLMSPNSNVRTNTVISGVPGVTISFSGEGILTLAGLIGQVRPAGETVPLGEFIAGRGHSGCRFSTAGLSVQGYSAPQALDYQSVSGTLIETGDWE